MVPNCPVVAAGCCPCKVDVNGWTNRPVVVVPGAVVPNRLLVDTGWVAKAVPGVAAAVPKRPAGVEEQTKSLGSAGVCAASWKDSVPQEEDRRARAGK